MTAGLKPPEVTNDILTNWNPLLSFGIGFAEDIGGNP